MRDTEFCVVERERERERTRGGGRGVVRSVGGPRALAAKRRVDTTGEWTPAMVAAYGVFRRAKSLFGEFARARVVSCGRGRVSRGARAVAEAAGVSVTTLDGGETVDLAERWRGSLVFAPAKGNERIEIEGLRLSAMELDLSYGSKRVATNDAAFGGHRTNADETPLSSALRVVEIVRAGDIPSVYLSAVPPLRLRMDDVPQSRALRESLFSSWSEAAAQGDAGRRARHGGEESMANESVRKLSRLCRR